MMKGFSFGVLLLICAVLPASSLNLKKALKNGGYGGGGEGDSQAFLLDEPSNGCAIPVTHQTRGTKIGGLFPLPFHPPVYRTGPFATNANSRNTFNDFNQAFYLKGFTRVFNPISQITPFENSDGVCNGLTTQYEKHLHGVVTSIIAGPHPGDALAPGSPLIFSGNSIKAIRGCGNTNINKIDYSVNTDSSNPKSCGSNTDGPGFNAYPLQFDLNQCTFRYISGNVVSNAAGDKFLSDMYFYWTC